MSTSSTSTKAEKVIVLSLTCPINPCFYIPYIFMSEMCDIRNMFDMRTHINNYFSSLGFGNVGFVDMISHFNVEGKGNYYSAYIHYNAFMHSPQSRHFIKLCEDEHNPPIMHYYNDDIECIFYLPILMNPEPKPEPGLSSGSTYEEEDDQEQDYDFSEVFVQMGNLMLLNSSSDTEDDEEAQEKDQDQDQDQEDQDQDQDQENEEDHYIYEEPYGEKIQQMYEKIKNVEETYNDQIKPYLTDIQDVYDQYDDMHKYDEIMNMMNASYK